MNKKKVALGLSGGVDSAVAARLLLDQGYDVSAIFLECWSSPGCRADQDRQDALKVAAQLEIPFQVLDFKQVYHQQVIKRFIREYQQGLTPNPDVWCNQVIKFGLFYDWARQNSFEYLATGHYARIGQVEGRLSLLTPEDLHKDQTYFIHQIQAAQLSHVLFPLQDLEKAEVRRLAEKNHFHVAGKKDSVGICFVGDVNVKELLKLELGENPGQVVNSAGQVIGAHQGLWFYTIGQRHGFTVQVNQHNIPPFYVIGKDAAKNQLIVGFGRETTQDHFGMTDLQLIDTATKLIDLPNLKVRIRHTGQLLDCQVKQIKDQLQVKLDQPERGIAPGQYAVFYQPLDQRRYRVLGGGLMI